MSAFPWRGHAWGVGLVRYEMKQKSYFQCLWWMWYSRHGSVFSLFLTYTPFYISPPHFLSFILSLCLFISFAVRQQKRERWRWPVAGPGAATQDMGAASHSRSCLVLQPVELLHFPHKRRNHHTRGTLHHLTVPSCEVISLLSFFCKENTEPIMMCKFLIKRRLCANKRLCTKERQNITLNCGWIYLFILRNIKNAIYIDNDLNTSLLWWTCFQFLKLKKIMQIGA